MKWHLSEAALDPRELLREESSLCPASVSSGHDIPTYASKFYDNVIWFEERGALNAGSVKYSIPWYFNVYFTLSCAP